MKQKNQKWKFFLKSSFGYEIISFDFWIFRHFVKTDNCYDV